MKRKRDEYIAMGAKRVWIINPLNRTAFQWLGNKWKKADRPEVLGTAIHIDVQHLRDNLDQGARATKLARCRIEPY